jgi:Tfp pilus assembly ATPase PilU
VTEGRTLELGSVIDQGNEAGMISFNLSLRRLILAGLIDVETALQSSDRPDELRLALRGFSSGGPGGSQPGQDGQPGQPGPPGLRLGG